MCAKNLGTENVRWQLARFFYSDIDDLRLVKDAEELVKNYEDFYIRFNGKLSEALGSALREFVLITALGEKIGMYLMLQKSLDVSDSKLKEKEAELSVLISASAGKYLEFFSIELASLSDEDCERWYGLDKFVEQHKSWIEQVRCFKSHMLSEAVEGALTKRSTFGPSAWSELHEELVVDLEIEVLGMSITLEEAISVLDTSQDENVRVLTMKAMNDAFKGYFAKCAAQVLWIVVGSNAVECEERSYEHPMRFRNMENRVSDDMVSALHNAVRNVASPIAKRFYRLKAKHLGLEKLRWSDRNAQMPFSDSSKIHFDDALKMVIDAYEQFSPTLARRVRLMVSDGRIDARAKKGKSDGAFCTWAVLPQSGALSFTLLNYLGGSGDVMTLAHEVGHGVHGEEAGDAQGVLMCNAPTAYAETASIFGEMTTFNFLKNRLLEDGDKKALLILLMRKIDDSMNSMVRQIGFSNFERRIHGMNETYSEWGRSRKISAEELSNIWVETISELYGEDGDVFTYDNMEYFWTYVSHFHNPFYVYGYAFGELLTQSLYAVRDRFGNEFEPLYLDMLRSGSKLDVVELLTPFGLNPTSEQFWINGINVGIGSMLKEAEELSLEMGISL